jgi:type 2 lantibiotic biosynthesis protein LanM
VGTEKLSSLNVRVTLFRLDAVPSYNMSSLISVLELLQMTINQSDLAKIVAEAMSLPERFERLGEVKSAGEAQDAIITKRLKHWCRVAAKGDWERFRKRLGWDDLDIATVCPALAMAQPEGLLRFPTWAETLISVIQATASFPDTAESSRAAIKFSHPLPFQDIWLPSLSVAKQKLLKRLEGYDSPLTNLFEGAYASLEYSLLETLVEISARTVLHEFRKSRPLDQILLSVLFDDSTKLPTTAYYNRFIQDLMQDGLRNLFLSYPVLARLISIVIDYWVDETAEFLLRLKHDVPKLERKFNVERTQLGRVVSLQSSLGDPHNQRRSVKVLTFESGLKVVYKPRNLAIEAAFNQFLYWCNSTGLEGCFHLLTVLDRKKYGWVEFVEQKPLIDEPAAHRFYNRAGKLLCLLYVLGATDCHHENLVANGEHLLLIDLETLVYHDVSWRGLSSEETVIASGLLHLWDSVLRTGLLPSWQFSKDKQVAFDISGLGSTDPEHNTQRVPVWTSINTDYMDMSIETASWPPERNVPLLSGRPLSPNDYVDDVVQGFDETYRFLIQQRSSLINTNSPISGLRGQSTRFVVRATQTYSVVVK